MCIGFSVETVWPVAGLLIAEKLPQEDQALGGGLLQTISHVSRSLGLAVSTAVQSAAQANSSENLPPGDADLLRGLCAAQ